MGWASEFNLWLPINMLPCLFFSYVEWKRPCMTLSFSISEILSKFLPNLVVKLFIEKVTSKKEREKKTWCVNLNQFICWKNNLSSQFDFMYPFRDKSTHNHINQIRLLGPSRQVKDIRYHARRGSRGGGQKFVISHKDISLSSPPPSPLPTDKY